MKNNVESLSGKALKSKFKKLKRKKILNDLGLTLIIIFLLLGMIVFVVHGQWFLVGSLAILFFIFSIGTVGD
ncbi:hypothetical protein [Microbulbifer sp. JMSA002]|uniref:hypothetical protein n=1 Tax=Microbulbifer sp. JMSA002 TaxID=3243368 RepID=UPI00403A5215